MNSRLKLTIALAALFTAGPLVGQGSRTPEGQLKAAHDRAEFEGDPKGAIEMYKKIADGKDKALAVKALFGMANAYRMLGDAEAQKVYQRIVDKFSDQKDAVTEARTRLAALRPAIANGGMVIRDVLKGAIVAVSFDGRYAYVSSGTVRDLSTGTERPLQAMDPFLTKPGAARGNVGAFSRDGKQLAYAARDTAEVGGSLSIRLVYLQSNGASQSREVFRARSDIYYFTLHDWTPDGNSILITLIRRDGASQIGAVDVRDGSLRVLKTVDWRGPGGMTVSPDGRYLAYDIPANDSTRQRDVFVLALDGTFEEAIVAKPTDDAVVGWSPDGRYLIFTSQGQSGDVGLRALPVASGKARGGARLIKSDFVAVPPMGLTSNGALYYNVPETSKSEIRLEGYDFDSGKSLGASSGVIPPIEGDEPAWSPDGKYLAYLHSVDTSVLTIQSLETGGIRQVRPALHSFNSLRWSPDNRSFLLSGTDFKRREGLYVMDAMSGEVTPFACDDACRNPAWSPDGKAILYERLVGGNRSSLLVRDLATGQNRELISGRISGFALAPDGRRIAMNNDGAVLVMSADGTESKELIRGTFLAWAPDSRSLMARTSGDTVRVALDGQARKTDFAGASSYFGRFGWNSVPVSPDGRRIARVSSQPGNPAVVRVLENFLPAIDAVPEQPQLRLPPNYSGPVFEVTGSPAPPHLTWVDRKGQPIGKVILPQGALDCCWYALSALSSDGKRAAITGTDLWTLELASGAATRIASDAGNGEKNENPVWSPDGARLAVTKNKVQGASSEIRDIWMLEIAKGTMTQITFGKDNGRITNRFVWSPDGTQIAFVRWNADQKTAKLVVKRANATDSEEVLTEARNFDHISWSPDGKFIVYVVNDPKTGQDIWAYSIGDRKAVPVMNGISEETFPVVSPDGKWLAYSSDRDGNPWNIYIRPFPYGAGEWKVSDGVDPRWRADGKELYFFRQGRDRSSGYGIAAVEIRAGSTAIEHGPPESLNIDVPTTFLGILDGRRFLILQ